MNDCLVMLTGMVLAAARVGIGPSLKHLIYSFLYALEICWPEVFGFGNVRGVTGCHLYQGSLLRRNINSG